MAVAIPTEIDIMTAQPNTKERATIGAPGSGVKTQGNIPPNTSATQVTVGNGTTEGYTFNFDQANGASSSALSYDCSSETWILVGSWQFNAPNRIELNTLANGGIEFRLVTGTGDSNYRSFYICGSDSSAGKYQANGINGYTIDMNATADHASDPADTGTYDNTDVQCWGWIVDSVTNGGSTHLSFHQRLHAFETSLDATNIVKFTGTSNFDDIIEEVLGTADQGTDAIGGWVRKLGTAFFIPCAFQIGDASTATNFDMEGATVVSPGNAEASDPRFRLTTQAMRFYARLRDNVADDIILDGTFVWSTAAPFDLDFDNSGSVNITGCSFNGMGDTTMGGSVSGSATFSLASGSDVIINGAVLDGSVINGNSQLHTETNLTNLVINGDLAISSSADSTLSFNNVNVTGDVVNDSNSNTLTINATNGSVLTTSEPGTGNGEVNIINNTNITVEGLKDNTEVRILSGSSFPQIELAGIEDAIDGSVDDRSFTFSLSAGLLVDIAIISVGYENERINAYTIPTSDSSIPISQRFDRNYSNP